MAKCRHAMPALRYEVSVLRSLWSGRPRAAYVGFVGYGNLGDEVLLQAHQGLFAGIDLTTYRKSRLLVLLHRVTGRRRTTSASWAEGPSSANTTCGWKMCKHSRRWECL